MTVYDPARRQRHAHIHRPRGRRRLDIFLGGVIVLMLGLVVACGSSSANQAVLRGDSDLMARQLNQLRLAQPIHFYLWSQDVANMNSIMDARTAGKTTFTLFFNYGVPDPYDECVSRGFPLPGDTELTNPDQIVSGYYSGSSSGYYSQVVPQIDPNGTYTSHGTNGTYIMCFAPNGQLYPHSAEPLIDVRPFPVTWDYVHHHVVIDPASVPSFSVPFDEAKAGQTPMDVITGQDGSTSLKTRSGTLIPVSGTPAASPTRTP